MLTVTLFCECMSFVCQEPIEVSVEAAMSMHGSPYAWLANTCTHGPEPTDVLVEEREGYKIYREVK